MVFHGSPLIWLCQNNEAHICTAGENHEPPAVPAARYFTDTLLCLSFCQFNIVYITLMI